jgi:hypothetical protein
VATCAGCKKGFPNEYRRDQHAGRAKGCAIALMKKPPTKELDLAADNSHDDKTGTFTPLNTFYNIHSFIYVQLCLNSVPYFFLVCLLYLFLYLL